MSKAQKNSLRKELLWILIMIKVIIPNVLCVNSEFYILNIFILGYEQWKETPA
jgi:hypothetical protein